MLTEKERNDSVDSEQNRLTFFISRLETIRRRLIFCIIVIIIGFIISYNFKETLFSILMRPLIKVMKPGEKMIYTGLAEAFFCYIKVAFFSGILLSMPLILYELWIIIIPAFDNNKRRFLLPTVFISLLFFACGVVFCYFIIFPFAFRYLIGFSTESIRAMPSMTEFFSLTSILLLAFGFIFELPLVMTLIMRFGLVHYTVFTKHRKYAILLIFIISAFLTPTPDAMNQLLMAGPLMILYEMGILGGRILGKKKS